MKQQTPVKLQGQGVSPCPIHIHVSLTQITLKDHPYTELIIDEAVPNKDKIEAWLLAYFEGKNLPFPPPVNWDLFTPFQKTAYQELVKIPPGRTCSYQDIAVRMGIPKGARAVGNACGKNPFPLLIPCHRVLRSNGTLGGFAYGCTMKQNLLNFEKSLTKSF